MGVQRQRSEKCNVICKSNTKLARIFLFFLNLCKLKCNIIITSILKIKILKPIIIYKNKLSKSLKPRLISSLSTRTGFKSTCQAKLMPETGRMGILLNLSKRHSTFWNLIYRPLNFNNPHIKIENHFYLFSFKFLRFIS